MCCLHVYLHYTHAVPTEARRGHWSPGIEAADTCEPSCGYWVLNQDSLEEQLVLCTTEQPSSPTFLLRRKD